MSIIEDISKRTGISIKELNRLNQNSWYHATTVEDAYNILENGVDAFYNVGKGSDYGPGFYMTASLDTAESYISKLPILDANGKILMKRESWAILRFEFNPFILAFQSDGRYSYKNFPKFNDEFGAFALQNWLHTHENLSGNYDIIWGVMSDSLPDKIATDYEEGLISYDEAIKAFQKSTSMKQLCVKNQLICSGLQPIIEKEVR